MIRNWSVSTSWFFRNSLFRLIYNIVLQVRRLDMNWIVSQRVQFYTCADSCQVFSNTHLDKRFSGGDWTVPEHELSYSLLIHSQNLLSCISSVQFISVGVRVETCGFTAQLLPHGFRNVIHIECVRWVHWKKWHTKPTVTVMCMYRLHPLRHMKAEHWQKRHTDICSCKKQNCVSYSCFDL